MRISIHAPREGSDPHGRAKHDEARISIHAPREGSDWCRGTGSRWRGRFLSTLPVRGATFIFRNMMQCYEYFYPRSP